VIIIIAVMMRNVVIITIAVMTRNVVIITIAVMTRNVVIITFAGMTRNVVITIIMLIILKGKDQATCSDDKNCSHHKNSE